MSARPAVSVRERTPDDDAGVSALAARAPMRGLVTVATVPGPRGAAFEPFVAPRTVWVAEDGAGWSGGAGRSIVGFISLGRRATRLPDGQPLPWGYLGDLRVAPDFRRQGVALALTASALAEERRAGSTLTAFATLGGNAAVEALIRREELPPAVPAARMRLVYWLTLRAPPRPSAANGAREVRAADLPDMWRLLDGHWRARALAPAPSLDTFAAEWDHDPTLSLADAVVVERGGRLVACGALWDQRPLRQEVVLSYRFPLSAIARAVRGLAGLLRAPRLPRPGEALSIAFVRHFAATDADAARAVRDALLARARARGIAIVAAGFDRRDPLSAAAAGALRVELGSTVWVGGPAAGELGPGPLSLDYGVV